MSNIDELTHQKIRPLKDLGPIAASLRAEGQKVVQCHGVFDLLHLGHVRHLEAAAKLGDCLIVTLTADAFVNKGPGRPVFTGAMRAEMIAALAFVDYVAINNTQAALPALETVKPSIYAKGMDYADAAADVTGNITREREMVETYGGELLFTDEIVFSSTELINRHMDVHDPEVTAKLTFIRDEHGLEEALAYLERVKGLKVAVVGDAIIDEYQYVNPLGKATKDNIIATVYKSTETFAGGSIAIANNIAGLCDSVSLITVLGDQNSYEEFIQEHLLDNLTMHAVHRSDAPTTLKRRFVEFNFMRKLFEVYEFDDRPLQDSDEQKLVETIKSVLPGHDLVVVCDFGHGMISQKVQTALEGSNIFTAVNTQTNSANVGFNLASKYNQCGYIVIDGPEARLAVRDKFGSFESIINEKLPAQVRSNIYGITLGQEGFLVRDKNGENFKMPAFASKVVDRVGAGDAVFAATSPLAALGAPLPLLALVGNIAGAIKVTNVGHRKTLDSAAIQKSLKALLT